MQTNNKIISSLEPSELIEVLTRAREVKNATDDISVSIYDIIREANTCSFLRTQAI